MYSLSFNFELSQDFWFKAGTPATMPSGYTFPIDTPIQYAGSQAIPGIVADLALQFPALNALLTTNPVQLFTLNSLGQQAYSSILQKDPAGYLAEFIPVLPTFTEITYIIFVLTVGEVGKNLIQGCTSYGVMFFYQ